MQPLPMTKPMFAWDALEDSPSVRTVAEFLKLLPDGELLDALRRHRGRGRNQYPVRVLWGVVLMSILLRHPGIESCLGELRRNKDLRGLLGLMHEHEVPKKWNVSRFLDTLGSAPYRDMMREVFNQLAQRLGGVVNDLGERTAGDSMALSARAPRGKEAGASGDGKKKKEEEEEEEGKEKQTEDGLPLPTGGHKEYTDEKEKIVKVLEWFGYKLHLLVCAKHEVALAFAFTGAGDNDGRTLPPLVGQAKANLPAGRIQSLAYDKAADSGDVHTLLAQENIKALIQNRALWKDELERKLPGDDASTPIVYDEAGTLFCYDTVSATPVRRQMAFIGHEPARGTIKYRCPAMHGGFPCASFEKCNQGRTYGLTKRVPCAWDYRRWPRIPRSTKLFERLYKGRTAVERVNGRMRMLWGADDGNLGGPKHFVAMVQAILIVHLGLATLLASTGRTGSLGGLHLTPVAKALRAQGQK